MYKRIVVPLDGSKIAEAALPHVVEIAKALGAEVVLLRVIQPGGLIQGRYVLPPGPAKLLSQELERSAQRYLDRAGGDLEQGGLRTQKVVVTGPVADSIVDWATHHNADLIALTSHGLGRAARWVFGSVADRLLQSSPVPLLVIRASHEVLEAQEEYEEEQLDAAVLKALQAS
ncbi:MAG: universal stress protein [Chloroflexi bacterium]|nr:universal stress protein [Chloroflexota bacterium]